MANDFYFYGLTAPQIIATVSAHGVSNNYLGQEQTLICSITGTDNLVIRTTTFQWTKYNGTSSTLIQIQGNSNNTLYFSPLRVSDAGRYNCTARIDSDYLSGSIWSIPGSYEMSLHSKLISNNYSILTKNLSCTSSSSICCTCASQPFSC